MFGSPKTVTHISSDEETWRAAGFVTYPNSSSTTPPLSSSRPPSPVPRPPLIPSSLILHPSSPPSSHHIPHLSIPFPILLPLHPPTHSLHLTPLHRLQVSLQSPPPTNSHLPHQNATQSQHPPFNPGLAHRHRLPLHSHWHPPLPRLDVPAIRNHHNYWIHRIRRILHRPVPHRCPRALHCLSLDLHHCHLRRAKHLHPFHHPCNPLLWWQIPRARMGLRRIRKIPPRRLGGPQLHHLHHLHRLVRANRQSRTELCDSVWRSRPTGWISRCV